MITVRPGRAKKKPGSGGGGGGSGGGKQISAPLIYATPTRGLATITDASVDLSGCASVLENWLPTVRGARLRGGSVKTALAEDGGALLSAFSYNFAGVEKLFMATAGAIYDFSSPPVLPATTPEAVGGFTGGQWSTFQHTTAGASLLIAVNGMDPRQVYNGSTWSTTPAITFSDATTSSELTHGWLFKNREFYIKANSLDAYYLDEVNVAGGEASVFPLGGVMKKGGSLITGFSWSVESGDGANALCVFISSEGEAAVYSGSNPGDANDFGLRGVYQIGRPLGKGAFLAVGGDILIATAAGMITMSQVLQRDGSALSLTALSQPINREWSLAVAAAGGDWNLTYWQSEDLVLVSFPENAELPNLTFVFNVLTKAWGFIRNWNANCFGMVQGRLYFGSGEGYFWSGDFSGSDDGLPFQATYLSSFQAAGALGQRKSATLASMTLKAKSQVNVLLFARGDYDTSIPTMSTATEGDSTSSDWDVGLWDLAKWDAASEMLRLTFRQTVRASGESLAVGAAITSSGQIQLSVELDLGKLQVQSGEQTA